MIQELVQGCIEWILQQYPEIQVYTSWNDPARNKPYFVTNIVEIEDQSFSNSRYLRKLSLVMDYIPDETKKDWMNQIYEIQDRLVTNLQVLKFGQNTMRIIDKTMKIDQEKNFLRVQLNCTMRLALSQEEEMMQDYNIEGGVKNG